MQVLILGSGGRENAFAWKIAQSPLCTHIWIAPGNAGTMKFGTNVAINPLDFAAVRQLVIDKKIDLVLVGPEEPLVMGIRDFFQSDLALREVALIGPSKEGAQLEGSKAYAKTFMMECSIPTAAYREFSFSTLEEGLAYLEDHEMPVVLKADGLAAGKGVLICDNKTEAQTELKAMLEGKFGQASSKVVIEQFLSGIEFSVFALTDGKNYQLLPVAKDYKRVGEGDTGLNTGGMGAVSPVPFVDKALMDKVEEQIIRPTVAGLQRKGIAYNGFLFFGLILVGQDPFVIEYNCRMGDPETEAVLPRMQNDLLKVLLALDQGTIDQEIMSEDPRFATTIMLVSGGYPGNYTNGKLMEIPPEEGDTMHFHSGTIISGTDIVTNGGRVLAVTALGDSIPQALAQANKIALQVQFEGKNYRKDIGLDLSSI